MRRAAILLTAVMGMVMGGGVAQAYLVRGPGGRLYGLLPAPTSRWHQRAVNHAVKHRVIYSGGSVMLSTTLRLIFWGPPGAFAPGYQGSITQWAEDLAADAGRTTNEFSIASLYYATHPRRYISRDIYFGGAVSDPTPYPANGCLNPSRQRATCLSDGQLQAEVARVIRAQGWPRDRPGAPRNQYLLFTPAGVSLCQDRLDTTCTFSSDNSICAYHGSFPIGRTAIVYSILPDIPSCDSGQAPLGVGGDPDADGTLDSAIHEVLESATDPGTRGPDDYGWTDNPGNEIGDECNLDSGTLYGPPLGGSLGANTAFNQLIAGHGYYTQEIWAIRTPRRAAGCVQRVGPSPVFSSSSARTGAPVSFDASGSFDLSGRITAYAWSYGDGSPLAVTRSAHSTHAYTQPGAYQVSLSVIDGSGLANVSTQTQTVVVQ